MINFRRLSKYLLAYLLLLIISAAITVGGVLRPVDLFIYNKFYLNSQLEKYNDQFSEDKFDVINNEINDKIIFIDIPTKNFPKNTYVKNLRSHIADLLVTIDSMVYTNMSEPPVVILDITFRSDSVGLDPIMDAVNNLIGDKRVKVYAAYELPQEHDNTKFDAHDAGQAGLLYDYYFNGNRLNTAINNYQNVNGLANYKSFELIDTVAIESLPIRVVNDYFPDREKTDLTNQVIYPLPLKLPYDPVVIEDNYYFFTSDSAITETQNFLKLKSNIDLSNKFVIVGTPDDQVSIGNYLIPGPYVVASALVDQLNGSKFVRPSYNNRLVQVSFVLLFALFVCLIFSFIYKYVKNLQTLPYVIAIISFLIGVIFLGFIGYVLLEYTVIRPALPTLSMLWAAVLSWHFTKKFLVTGIMEGGDIYDVFISYSHGDSAWVKKNLYGPLANFTKPDGKSLNIFFDENSIGIGELFTTKYMRSIVDSKMFIPVISKEYYHKNHCINEMDLAVKRHVEKLMDMCIVALDYKYVPEEFTNINFVDVSQQENFMSKLKDEITKEDKNKLKAGSINDEENTQEEETSMDIDEQPIQEPKNEAIAKESKAEINPGAVKEKVKKENSSKKKKKKEKLKLKKKKEKENKASKEKLKLKKKKKKENGKGKKNRKKRKDKRKNKKKEKLKNKKSKKRVKRKKKKKNKK